MFAQQKLLFQFTKSIALIILLCFTFSYQAHGEKAVQEKAKVAETTAQIKYDYEKEFEEEVKKRLAALKQEFNKARPKFEKMADLLGDNTVLATPQGERLKGKESLSRFWRKEKDRGVIDVNFTLKYHYVIKVADPIEQPNKLDTIVHIGHAIIVYQLISPPKLGASLTNKTGTFTMSLRHPRICEWD